jgi:hypothetical protein
MHKILKTGKIAALLVFPLFFLGCLRVQIIRHVGNPDEYFDKAYRQIERIERDNPRRMGRAHELSVCVYDHEEDQIVKLTVPLWLVNFALNVGLEAAEHDREFRKWDGRFDFDWRALKDLGQFGPGLLVAVDDDRDKVLVWLR